MNHFMQSYLPQAFVSFRHKPSERTAPAVALLKKSKKQKELKCTPAEAASPSSELSLTKTKSKASALTSGPIDLDENVENDNIMLVEIKQLLRDNQLRQKIIKSGSCSSVSSCSFASSTASFSDASSMKETRRVVFSDKVTYIEPMKYDKSFDRRTLWRTRKDQQEALKAVRHEARILASSAQYRAACTTVLLHCKALSTANEDECLSEDHAMADGGGSSRSLVLLTNATPQHVIDAVRYLVDPQVRGLERACLQRLRLRTPGRPCYCWRCSPVQATASVLQLQSRLSNLLDLSHEEKWCLISVQYQPYGFYASTWAQLLAEGDTFENERDCRRVSL